MKVNVVWSPKHMGVTTLIVPLGVGLTVITVLLDTEVLVQLFASVIEVMAYVVVTDGDTETVCPLEIPVRLNWLVPSVYCTL